MTPHPPQGTVMAAHCTKHGRASLGTADGNGGVEIRPTIYKAECEAPEQILKIQELFQSIELDAAQWYRFDNDQDINQEEIFQKLKHFSDEDITHFIEGFFPPEDVEMEMDIGSEFAKPRSPYRRPRYVAFIISLTREPNYNNDARRTAYGLITAISSIIKKHTKPSTL